MEATLLPWPGGEGEDGARAWAALVELAEGSVQLRFEYFPEEFPHYPASWDLDSVVINGQTFYVSPGDLTKDNPLYATLEEYRQEIEAKDA